VKNVAEKIVCQGGFIIPAVVCTRNENWVVIGMKNKIIDKISAEDALIILKRLVAKESSFEKQIEMEAEILLSAIDLEEICEAVYSDLDQIEVQELWDRSGKSRYGYVSPEEMAVEMMENELAPYNENVFRYIDLEKYTEAKTYCMGLLKGIYTYSTESNSEFKDWAVDMPEECFGFLLENWLKKTDNAKDKILMDNFLEEYCPAWYHWGHQIIEKAKKGDSHE
jgi:hypothetical protein